MSKKRRRIIILIVAGAGLAAFWMFYQGKIFLKKGKSKEVLPAVSEEVKPSQVTQGLPVKVFRTAKTDYQDIIQAMGNIKGQREIDLRFEVQGILKAFNFLEGEVVEKAQVIAELNPKDYRQRVDYAKTKLKSALAELAKKNKEYEMYKQLYAIGAIIKLKLEQSFIEYKQTQLEVENKKRELEFADMELDKTRIYASGECVVGSSLVSPGQLVFPTTKIGVLVDARTALAEVSVVEREIRKLSIDQKVNLYVDAYPGVIFSGVISSIQPIVTEKSRTVLVKITVDNSNAYLLSGMFTRVEIIIFDKKDVIMVPKITIQEKEDKLQVYIVDPKDNKAKEREVEMDYNTDEYAEITSGLSVDDLVILNPDDVSGGMPVNVVEEESLGL